MDKLFVLSVYVKVSVDMVVKVDIGSLFDILNDNIVNFVGYWGGDFIFIC